MLKKNIAKGPFRLIGLNLSQFSNPKNSGWENDFFNQSELQTLAAEEAIDKIRSRFGARSIIKGRSLGLLK